MGFMDKLFGTKDKPAPGKAEGEGAADLISALSLHLQGDADAALAAYLKIAEGNPQDGLARFLVAAVKARKGAIVEAAEDLRLLSREIASTGENITRAISVDLGALLGEEPAGVRVPSVAGVILTFGDDLKRERFVQESAVCFEIAAALLPERAEVLYKLGDTLHDLRMYQYAESVLLRALEVAPNHWDSLYTYAVLLQDLGRDEEAIPYYEKAVRFNPDHAKCRNNYGAALMRTNRLEEALAQCNQAAGLDPSSPFVQINLGNIHLLMQEHEKARERFTRALSLNDRLAPAYFGLASAERALKADPERIRELYRKAIEVNPAIAEAHHALANLLAEAGDAEALSHYATAAELNPDLRNLYRDFGAACLHLGRREEGIEHLKKALEQNPDNATVRELLEKERTVQ